jgi:hypothetical protein
VAEITRRLGGLTLPRLPIPWIATRALSLAFDWSPLVLAGALGLAGAWFYVDSPRALRPIFDDSYISLTFARNLAEHAKLSFDGETWSTGATSPFHVAVLALVLKAGAEPVFADVAVSVAGHVLLAASVYLLGWALFRSRLAGLLGAFAIAFTSYAAVDAGNGLETSLFLALVSLSMATYILNRGPLGRAFTGLLIGLSVLTRPEGGFLLLAIVVFRWIDREKGEPLRLYLRDAALLSLPAVVAVASLSLYSLSVNDSLGGTATAKLRFFQEAEQPFRDRVGIAADNLGYFIGPLLPLIALAVAAPRRKEFAMFALFWAPVLALYAVLFPGGMLHYFFRYQHPVMPFIAVMAGGGAAALLVYAWRSNLVVKALVVAGIGLAIVPMWEQYDRWRGIYEQASTETLVDLEAMARDLNTIVRPDQVLATHDIGAVGYYAEYHVLDLVGLVNPDVIPFHKKREVAKYVDSVRPDYLLTFPEWDYFFLRIHPGDNPQKYELIKVYPGGNIRLSSYVLYRIHHDEPPPPEEGGQTEGGTPPEPP